MQRRNFIMLFGGAAAAWPLAARAQGSAKRPIVAMLAGQSALASAKLVAAFAQRMQELGYSASRNVDIVYRYMDGDLTRVPALVKELIGLQPDVMVITNTEATIAMRQATAAIPIISAAVTDPVAFGLVASHARPGGNVTGILATLDSLPEKQLALAVEVIHDARKMGLLIQTGFRAHAVQRQGAEAAAAALAITVVPVEARLPGDVDAAFQSFVRERVDGVLVLQAPLFLTERQRIAALATAAKLPTMFGFREHAEAGGLMSYGVDLRANWRRAAEFVDKILKGTNPGDLPVELPTKFELVVNLKTAKTIELKIPESFLLRADEVIE
jgi:putative ABC transport system substrate-binding protein